MIWGPYDRSNQTLTSLGLSLKGTQGLQTSLHLGKTLAAGVTESIGQGRRVLQQYLGGLVFGIQERSGLVLNRAWESGRTQNAAQARPPRHCGKPCDPPMCRDCSIPTPIHPHQGWQVDPRPAQLPQYRCESCPPKPLNPDLVELPLPARLWALKETSALHTRASGRPC